MVNTLIKLGADLHQRSTGKFFCPTDQKSTRTHLSLFLNNTFLTTDTNYEGDFYFGEYPLSIAACLNQPACVGLLIAEGADTNKQDSNGNTVIHMLVIYDNLVNIASNNKYFFI